MGGEGAPEEGLGLAIEGERVSLFVLCLYEQFLELVWLIIGCLCL